MQFKETEMITQVELLILKNSFLNIAATSRLGDALL